MRLFERVENLLLAAIDGMYALLPQPHPGVERLRGCQIISHRGEHDNRRVFENTLAAFDAAVAQGVWGIEFDLRWTRDLEPVVVHDPDLRRVFGRNLRVGDVALPCLRKEGPQVPTLAEVVGRYGGKVHLMMEIKAEPYPDRDRRNRLLGDLFAALKPGRDFHLLSLDPEMFRPIDFAPPAAFVPTRVRTPRRCRTKAFLPARVAAAWAMPSNGKTKDVTMTPPHADTLRLLSVLLHYPDNDLLGRLDEIAALARAEAPAVGEEDEIARFEKHGVGDAEVPFPEPEAPPEDEHPAGTADAVEPGEEQAPIEP